MQRSPNLPPQRRHLRLRLPRRRRRRRRRRCGSSGASSSSRVAPPQATLPRSRLRQRSRNERQPGAIAHHKHKLNRGTVAVRGTGEEARRIVFWSRLRSRPVSAGARESGHFGLWVAKLLSRGTRVHSLNCFRAPFQLIFFYIRLYSKTTLVISYFIARMRI